MRAILRGAEKNKNPQEILKVGADTSLMNQKNFQLIGKR
jgi:hypothetical protein